MRKRFLPFCVSCLMATMAVGSLTFVPQTAMAQENTAPSMEVTTEGVAKIQGVTNTAYEMGKVLVKTAHTKNAVTIEMTGKEKGQFAVNVTSIEPGTGETEIVITYKPTTVGQHKANLMIDCIDVPEQSTMIRLEGIAYDAANPPTVALEPGALQPFSCQATKTAEQTFKLTPANMAENISVTMAQKNAFRLNTASVYYKFPADIKVTFAPLKEGEFKDTIVISSYGLETQRIPVSGTATANTAEEEKEGVDLALSEKDPLLLMYETFDGVKHNKPLDIPGWTNVAVTGTRAWWGYKFPDYDELPNEMVAKVTPFDTKIETGDEKPCEMLLVSPPLDFKNAASKMLTLRVRGDYLQDNQTDEFKIYYLDLKDGKLFKSEIQGFNLPDTKDEAGTWNEYHLNLEGQKLNDVFFIGFGFKSMRGVANSATYYIDDVSYGRTDLPTLTLSPVEMAMEAEVGKEKVSNEITLKGNRLTENVKLTVGGPNAGKFKLSTNMLPKEGGTFRVSFKSDKVGVHEAYVKVASRGAADQYIALSANNKNATGLDTVSDDADLGAVATVYDLSGKKVLTARQASLADIKAQLKKGTYVVKAAGAACKFTVK
ncbi:MAG: choice-of-anchor J domain-containing protein [Prevotella sp.]|nr:choice-of-anchor J domain-containing protein [Prevotella sp.]MDY6129805.1 choice-of-anchor J domain-containing protein [Prevotella sp.]